MAWFKNRSTVTALTGFIRILDAMENLNLDLALLIDFSKLFACVNLDNLVDKLWRFAMR